MTVSELKDHLSLTAFHLPDGDLSVTGGYAGDLLSWVMGRAQAGDAWLTIMSSLNVCAVAVLTDVSCVILTEGVRPDADLLARAETQGINLLGSEESTFALAARLAALLPMVKEA